MLSTIILTLRSSNKAMNVSKKICSRSFCSRSKNLFFAIQDSRRNQNVMQHGKSFPHSFFQKISLTFNCKSKISTILHQYWASFGCICRGVKFPQNLFALMVYIFHLDAKKEEKVKKVLKISLALPKVILAISHIVRQNLTEFSPSGKQYH